MDNLEHKIEAVLLFKNEPVTIKELSSLLKVDEDAIKESLATLQNHYKERGLVVVSNGEEVSFGTHPSFSSLIEEIQKDELSRDIGRAGLETLVIVLYKGPVSRREIDYIRGVNSGFILRNLLIRGLVERTELRGERSYSYKPTLKLLEHLGVQRKEDLPEYDTAFSKLEEFVSNTDSNEDSQ